MKGQTKKSGVNRNRTKGKWIGEEIRNLNVIRIRNKEYQRYWKWIGGEEQNGT